MKKNGFFKFIYLLTLLVTLINVFFSLKNYLFADINELPVGEYKFSSESPSGNKKINIYYVENCLGHGIRGELQTKQGKKSNIFWQTDLDKADIVWINENNFRLNGIPFSATRASAYDCRRGTSLFRDGALVEDFID